MRMRQKGMKTPLRISSSLNVGIRWESVASARLLPGIYDCDQLGVVTAAPTLP